MNLEPAAIAYGRALAEFDRLNDSHATLSERTVATNAMLNASRELNEAAKEYFKQHHIAA